MSCLVESQEPMRWARRLSQKRPKLGEIETFFGRRSELLAWFGRHHYCILSHPLRLQPIKPPLARCIGVYVCTCRRTNAAVSMSQGSIRCGSLSRTFATLLKVKPSILKQLLCLRKFRAVNFSILSCRLCASPIKSRTRSSWLNLLISSYGRKLPPPSIRSVLGRSVKKSYGSSPRTEISYVRVSALSSRLFFPFALRCPHRAIHLVWQASISQATYCHAVGWVGPQSDRHRWTLSIPRLCKILATPLVLLFDSSWVWCV